MIFEKRVPITLDDNIGQNTKSLSVENKVKKQIVICCVA